MNKIGSLAGFLGLGLMGLQASIYTVLPGERVSYI